MTGCGRAARVWLVWALGVLPAWAAPQVDHFSPQGKARGVRQVAVRFTEPMIAFGDPRLADPFDVRCEGDAARLLIDDAIGGPAGEARLWLPTPGRHVLRLVDAGGAELDQVRVTVRGLR